MSKRVYTTLLEQNTLLRLDVSKSGDLGEKQVVRAAGVEPTTSGFGGRVSLFSQFSVPSFQLTKLGIK